tara:strand:+ start:130 stop:564 length:435 start_codon:yes stop_codon:yes gene_type:complete
MPIYNKNEIVVSHSVNGVSDSFATSNTLDSNNLTKLKFTIGANLTTATVGTYAKRDGLKYIGVSTEDALTGLAFRDSSGNNVLNMGAFSAGQTKHAVDNVTLDFALPSTSGNDIADVHVTKNSSAETSGEINIEIYYDHTESSS